jgi:hypothetical protein
MQAALHYVASYAVLEVVSSVITDPKHHHEKDIILLYPKGETHVKINCLLILMEQVVNALLF